MTKMGLLLGTACSGILACTSLAFAQDYGTATPILGISKTAGGGETAARTVKIPLKSTYSASIISKQVIQAASPATTAQQILAREPSIYVTNNGPGGVNQQITFRAFGTGLFSETINGVNLMTYLTPARYPPPTTIITH